MSKRQIAEPSAAAEQAAWHAEAPAVAWQRLDSDPERGLATAEANRRLSAFGSNEVRERGRRSIAKIVLGQFTDTMILVLIVAAIIAGVLGDVSDSIAILAIVALNALIGAAQEIRAQRTIEALRRMAASSARVRRDGRALSIPARDVVPGDLVLIEAGDIVPADVRLLDARGLSIDESSLTGESVAVEKNAKSLCDPEAPLGDRVNLAHKDTQVTRGRGRGIAVATGDRTEIGRIAELLEGEDTATPLQRRLGHFGRQLALAVIGICTALFLAGLLQGRPPLLMFLTAVSLAVAAVPEALPAVVTISLAIGARRLAALNALVRRLPAVEALGSVTYICADKTGTLTENRMRVGAIWADGRAHAGLPPDHRDSLLWQQIVAGLALNNDVDDDGGTLAGDPTELALYEAAAAAGRVPAELRAEMPRRGELAFDEERKRMTTLHRYGRGAIAYMKGAPEVVQALCRRTLGAGGAQPLDQAAVRAAARSLAASGYRVLALAYRELDALPDEESPEALEQDFVLLALIGLIDPPRPEAADAVSECRAAGIVPVLITGDHPETALHVAREVGIAGAETPIMNGRDLASLDDEALAGRVQALSVYARVSPEQKIRIVTALQARGELAAMTGDGVNDAPALKRADIGIAMGKRGTDVAREAADMVLLDDNFATIVAAVAEGRRIFDDIKKFIRYTMTSNAGEICTLVVAPLLGLPLPLVPIQILWVNLLTDGLPGLAFSAEPPERDIMRRPPRRPDAPVLDRAQWIGVIGVGLAIGAVTIASQWWEYQRGVSYWQTVTFTVLVVAQLWNALAMRSRRPLWEIGIFGNPALLGALAVTVAAQLAVIYVPALNPIFKTEPLPAPDLALSFGIGALVFAGVEASKLVGRWRHRGPRDAGGVR